MADRNRDIGHTVSRMRIGGRAALVVLLLLIFFVVLCVLTYTAVNLWRNMSNTNKVPKVEDLIGASLPSDATDLHFHHWEPGQNLAFFAAYIKFVSSETDFNDLMERMNMDFHNTEGAALMFLPAAWDTEQEVQLDWWEPGKETPAESAAAAYGKNGWIVAKFENGVVYMIVTDSDFFEG